MLNLCICAEYFHFFFKNLISINKLCPQPVLKHSVDHFQGIGMIFFSKYFCQNIWKYEIFIHQLWSQSVLKHSVDHFQGIRKFFLKNQYFLAKIC